MVLRLNKKGIGTTELLVSLCFVLIMVIYAWKILERQKIAVITSNQNIEIVDILNSMRKVLARPESCRATFSGLLPNQEPGEIDTLVELSVDGKEKEVFPISDFSEELYGQHGLKIKSYHLSKEGLSNKSDPFGTYLVITFDRSFNGLLVQREIKLFTSNNESRIQNCALGYSSNLSEEVWDRNESGDISTRKKVIIGRIDLEDSLDWKVVIQGGIQLFPVESTTKCSKEEEGSIFAINRGLRLCSSGTLEKVFEFGGVY